jgi:hypothetical protein
MCNSVHYEGREYNKPTALAPLIGGADKLVWREKHVKHDLCLCPVDLEATLGNAGFQWTRGPDPMEWFVSKRGHP